jgi:hypothetical protein
MIQDFVLKNFETWHKDLDFQDWEEVFKSFQPNIVMIWGTECLHSRNAVKISLLKKIPFIVFVQGILSTIYKYKFGKVSLLTRIKSFSIRDVIKLSFSPFSNFDEIKKVYGEEKVYPVCEDAKTFAQIAGTKTLTLETAKIFKQELELPSDIFFY